MVKTDLTALILENRLKAKRIREAEHYRKHEYDGGGFLEYPIEGKQNPEEEQNNRETYQILAKRGHQYRLLPLVKLDHIKNPDAFNHKTG